MMSLLATYHCATEEALASVARDLVSRFVPPLTVALQGNLGAGKTTFVRYFAEAAGATVPVSSPTYVLMHEYPLASGTIIEHWDLYRLGMAPSEVEEPPAPGMIRFIEWPGRDRGAVLVFDYVLHITIPSDTPGRQVALYEGPLRATELQGE